MEFSAKDVYNLSIGYIDSLMRINNINLDSTMIQKDLSKYDTTPYIPCSNEMILRKRRLLEDSEYLENFKRYHALLLFDRMNLIRDEDKGFVNCGNLCSLSQKQLLEVAVRMGFDYTGKDRFYILKAIFMNKDKYENEIVYDLTFILTDVIRGNLLIRNHLHKFVPRINKKLEDFNNRYNTSLESIIAISHTGMNDPWQTIKITDCSINEPNQVSYYLKLLNDYLYKYYGIVANDAILKGEIRRKRTPTSFIKNGILMKPQIQLSLMDMKKILGLITEEQYINSLT